MKVSEGGSVNASRVKHGLAARALATTLGVSLGLPMAWAQSKEPLPPMDLNAPLPGARPVRAKPGKKAPAAEVNPAAPASSADTRPARVLPDEVDTRADGERYHVSRFILEYRDEHAQQLPLPDLANSMVTLGLAESGYVEWRSGVRRVNVRLTDIQEGSASGAFYRSGLNGVAKGIVRALNERGQVGVFVQIHPEDINEETGADLRGPDRPELRLIVWTGRVAEVRSIASGERLAKVIEADPAAAINNADRVNTRIRERSPIKPGDLLRKDLLDNYTFRLNRHPGRHVDAAVSAGPEPAQVVVDYHINESKPWSLYAQLSNTGTESTNEWRERFGFVHNQVTGADDILRLDYTTAGFDASNAVLTSYEVPISGTATKVRAFGSFTEYTASDVGQAGEQFEGETWIGGGEVSTTAWQRGPAFFDVYVGMRYKNERVTNTFGDQGNENFWFPMIGARYERITDADVTFLDINMEFQNDQFSNNDLVDLQELGRLDVSPSWQVIRFAGEHSFFMEPKLNPRGYIGEDGTTGPTSLAHEIGLSLRGQWAFDYRLTASEQDVAGGFYTVRGYPEAVVAGDSMIIASAEYRFHLPRAFGVSAEPGVLMGRRMGVFGDQFRWQPQQAFGHADWDLILKTFVDAAATRNNEGQGIAEDDHTLVGVGVGAEFQWKRNVTMRLDWGVALAEVDDPSNPVDAGDNRLHFSVMVLY